MFLNTQSCSKTQKLCDEPYMHGTPPCPYRGVRRGAPTTATHVCTPTDHRAARGATPTLRERYIRRVGTSRRGSLVGATIRVTPERRSRRAAWRCLSWWVPPIGGYLPPRPRHTWWSRTERRPMGSPPWSTLGGSWHPAWGAPDCVLLQAKPGGNR